MIETIYEKKQAEEKQVRNFRLPNNRRQIGQPHLAELEVFIEDYAFSFAKELAERDYTGCVVGVLIGEYFGKGEKITHLDGSERYVMETRQFIRWIGRISFGRYPL